MTVRQAKRRMGMQEFIDWVAYLSDPSGEKPYEIELPQEQLIETIKAALEAG